MATPPRTARPPKAEAAGVSAARIRLGRVFRVESKDYFLLLGTTLFLVVFGLVMVLSSSSVGPQALPPMAQHPIPMAETRQPVRPNVRYCMPRCSL